MNAEMPKTRRRLIVSGNVQEAGFRVFVKSMARPMGIVGFVRNLTDETVEIVCEAEQNTLDRFLKAINRKGDPASPMDINVEAMAETPAPTAGEFKKFSIEYDGTLTPEDRERAREAREERMLVGASILKETMDDVGKDVREVGKDVRDMHGDMNTRFDHMADRYDMIAASLKEAIVHMDRNAEKTDKAIEKSRKETIIAVHRSEERTAKILRESHKELAASNRELAGAVKFMIKRFSAKAPVHSRPRNRPKKRANR